MNREHHPGSDSKLPGESHLIQIRQRESLLCFPICAFLAGGYGSPAGS